MKRVIVESPYKGNNWEDTEENVEFAKLCMHGCLLRGESPFASHLLYPQVLDDKIKEKRDLGIEAGFPWKEVADETVVYINRGIHDGMQKGIKKSIALGQKFEYRWLPNYEKNLFFSPSIISVTGEPGAGKTTSFGHLLTHRPKVKMITSFTSRAPRPSDLLGEYEYGLTAEEFKRRDKEFLWTKEYGGYFYRTTKKSIIDALDPSSDVDNSLMILVPDAVLDLRNHLSKFGGVDNLLSFYILSPGKEELQKRMVARGEKETVIQARLENYGKWDKDALASNIPYIFLRNDGSIEEVVQQMLVFL